MGRTIVETQWAAVAAGAQVRKKIRSSRAAMAGRLAVQDGAELAPTFGWPEERLVLLVAGGEEALLRSVEGAEDDAEQGIRLIGHHAITSQDVLIGVAASGTTRFTLASLREAKRRGALTLG